LSKNNWNYILVFGEQNFSDPQKKIMNLSHTTFKKHFSPKKQNFGKKKQTSTTMKKFMNSSHINWNIIFNFLGTKIWIRRNKNLSTAEQIVNSSHTNWNNI
jgi:hypothetical protein